MFQNFSDLSRSVGWYDDVKDEVLNEYLRLLDPPESHHAEPAVPVLC